MLCWLVFFHYFIVTIKCQGFYKVIGPRVIRPNSEYHVAVSVQSTSEPTTVSATLEGISYNGSIFVKKDRVIVQPYTSRICRMEIDDLDPGYYKLKMRGEGGLDFFSDYPLQYVNKSYSIFIQTDRAVYNPGSKVLFRAIVLNSNLKPAAEVRNEPLHIEILDNQKNKVKEWRGIEAVKGVFTEELILAKNPVLGHWNISVTIHGQTFSKSFEVAEYILPKFMVNINTPAHITFKQKYLSVDIETRYFYGKEVEGEATISVYPIIFSKVIQPIYQNPVTKVFKITGTSSVDFNIVKELKLNDEYERVVIIDVAVEEALTGRRQNNSAQVHIHKYDYKMDLIKTADYFKPGLKYTAYIKISKHDGTLLDSDHQPEVIVRHGYSRMDEVYQVNKHRIGKNGVIKLEFYTPRQVTNMTALRIEAEYQTLKERISPIPAAVSLNNNYLQISVETERPIVNMDVEISINCTEQMKYIDYVIMGRGDVLIANTFHIDNQQTFKFHFTASHQMTPLAHLIVTYTREDGELIGDSIDIEIQGVLQNFMDIQVSNEEIEPQLDIDFIIRAQPNSYIGLMAVDQNIIDLRPGFDLTMHQIVNELSNFDEAMQSPFYSITKDSKYHFEWKPGSNNPYRAIYDSGADLLTNAHINQLKPTLEDIYLRPVFYDTSTVKPDRGFGVPLFSVTRPPLAGPYAFSRIPRPVWNKPKIYLTQNIASTWLFTNFSSGYEGKMTIRRRVPETLNNWAITGFSLNPIHGLGLVNKIKKIKITEKFSINLDLPYAVQRGEIVAIPVVVFNNGNDDVSVDVTLHNPENKFEFSEISNDLINSTKKVELYRKKRLNVGKNSGNSVSFMIMPTKEGLIEIKATANSPRKQDMISKNLVVTTGGSTEYYTKSLLIDLRNSQQFSGTINISLPKNLIEGSEKIEISTVGDLLGPTIMNLDDLIRLPTACGEQNMVHFFPQLMILQYLKSTRQVYPTIEKKAKSLLETAYQEQLSFKRKDGSFGTFGERDEFGSVWLTAYVAYAFQQAKPFIYVDQNIIDNSLKWLEEHQGNNGSFYEMGKILHRDLQNNEGNSLALTAYTLLAFIENKKINSLYVNNINKGLDYIARNIDESESIYTIALCNYVLQMTQHPSKQSTFNLLDTRAKSENNRKWWAKEISIGELKNPWNKLPKSIDIETTAFAILSFIEANLIEDSIPVLRWLVDQQSDLGGFTSTHDTAFGLLAIYKLTSKIGVQSTNIQIDYSTKKLEKSTLNINKNNAMIVQKLDVNKNIKQINVTAQGSGLALFRVSYQYNMNVTGPWPLFILDPQVDKNSNENYLQISICTGFVSRNLSEATESNMAIMEVNFPSGFTVNIDSLPSLEVSQNVQKVQTSNDLTRIYLYFNNLTSKEEYCPTISAYRTHKVAIQKPVAIQIYDYYDSSRKARQFYSGKLSTLCDICENEDCGDICSSKANLQVGSSSSDEGKGNASYNYPIMTIIIITFITLIINLSKVNY